MANNTLHGVVSDVVRTFSFTEIIVNADDPRIHEPVDNLLKASLKKDGQLDSGIVKKLPTGQYVAIAGNRRLKALIELQNEENAKEVKDGQTRKVYSFKGREFTGTEAQELRLISLSNSYRKDWSLQAQVILINKMQEQEGMLPAEIASALGMPNAAHIYALLKLSKNDKAEAIYEALDKGTIEQTTALRLAASPDPTESLRQIEAVHKAEAKIAKAAAKEGKPVPKKVKVTAATLAGTVNVASRFNSADLARIADCAKTPETVRTWILANHFGDADSIAEIKQAPFIIELALTDFKSESAAEKSLRKQLDAANATEDEATSIEDESSFDDEGDELASVAN